MGRTWSDEAESVRSDRVAAARDRDVAALLLHQAELIREVAAADRNMAGLSLHQASLDRAGEGIDAPFGEQRREPALAALQLEIDRARRTGSGLAVGVVKLHGLKHENGSRAHSAEVLRSVESGIMASLRSYDIVVRSDADELVFTLAGGAPRLAAQRFEQMRASFECVTGDSVRAGFSALRDDDTPLSLITRAGADLCDRTPA